MPATTANAVIGGETTCFQGSQLSWRSLPSRNIAKRNSPTKEQARGVFQGIDRASEKQKTLRRASERLEKHSGNEAAINDLFKDQKEGTTEFGDDDSELKNEIDDNENKHRTTSAHAEQEDGEIALAYNTQAQDQDQDIHLPANAFASAEEEYFYFARGEIASK